MIVSLAFAAQLLAVQGPPPKGDSDGWCQGLIQEVAQAQQMGANDILHHEEVAKVVPEAERLPIEFLGLPSLTPTTRMTERQARVASLGVLARYRCGVDAEGDAIQSAPGTSPAAVDAAQARELAFDILRDPSFSGERNEADIFDRWLAALNAWLGTFFESAGGQAFAEATRVVYLVLLVLVAIFVLVRLARLARRLGVRGRRSRKTSDDALDRRRRRDAALLLSEAEGHLAAGRAHEAAWSAFLAVLARLGEVERGSAEPSRTHREILEAAPAGWAQPLGALFHLVEEAVYRRRIGEVTDAATAGKIVEGARSLLASAQRGTPGGGAG